jgi:hypothetical protein
MPFNGVNRPKNRSPLRYAAAQVVVLLWATVADLGSYLQASVEAYRDISFSV